MNSRTIPNGRFRCTLRNAGPLLCLLVVLMVAGWLTVDLRSERVAGARQAPSSLPGFERLNGVTYPPPSQIVSSKFGELLKGESK